ncbi:MAG: stage III sporulation protein AA [Lachnospiraceae bacterium]|nr:stage III sporulation protein AA [Lachnospiraceae bacterium]
MEEIIRVFPGSLRELCRKSFEEGREPEEIRLRIGQPVLVSGRGKEWFWGREGRRVREEPYLSESSQSAYLWTEQDMKETLARMSQYSMYALEEEIRSGFFTIQGGHRIGVAGKAVCQQGRITVIRSISSLNIRVARQKKDCARELLFWLCQKGSIYNTLILSPPGVGKTTMLRDCIRLLSEGTSLLPGEKIGLVDERGEVAASFFGIPQNDLGCRTDVLDACPKAEGMKLLLRSMSPQIIAVDELGGKEDCLAVEEVLNCGCRMLGTIHAGSIEELREKKYLKRWIKRGYFERFVLLSLGEKGERRFSVYDGKLQKLC